MLNRRNLRRPIAAASIITAMMFVFSAPFFFGGDISSSDALGADIFVPGVTIDETGSITVLTLTVQDVFDVAVTGPEVSDHAVPGTGTEVTDTLSPNDPGIQRPAEYVTGVSELTDMDVHGQTTLADDVTDGGAPTCPENGGTAALKGNAISDSGLFTDESNVTVNDVPRNGVSADADGEKIISGYVVMSTDHDGKGIYAADAGTLTSDEDGSAGMFSDDHTGTSESTEPGETDHAVDDGNINDLGLPHDAVPYTLSGDDDGSQCSCTCEDCEAAGECDGSGCGGDCECGCCNDGSVIAKADANIGDNGISQHIAYMIGCILLILMILTIMRLAFVMKRKKKEKEE